MSITCITLWDYFRNPSTDYEISESVNLTLLKFPFFIILNNNEIYKLGNTYDRWNT